VCSKIDFEHLGAVVAEFEEKTKPRFGSTDLQYENIATLVGMSAPDLSAVFKIADSYLEEEEVDIEFELKGMFGLGFTFAMYCIQRMNKYTEPIQ
jgi:hypothetical protein